MLKLGFSLVTGFEVKDLKMLGVVQWFNNAKGWGFIKPDNDGDDIFLHFKEIQCAGFKTLNKGDRVTFELEMSPKGPIAKGVSLATE